MREQHPYIFLFLFFSLIVGIALGCGIVLGFQAFQAEADKMYQTAERYREELYGKNTTTTAEAREATGGQAREHQARRLA